MIRNTMLGLSLFALMTGSALAATPVAHKHVSKPRTVAAAPAGDAAKAMDHLQSARALHRENRYEEAIPHYQQALALAPDLVEA